MMYLMIKDKEQLVLIKTHFSEDQKYNFGHLTQSNPSLIIIGAKLAVAPVARATPLFLPRPEIIYINVVHYSAPPRTYLLRATPLFRPLWRHCRF